MLPDNWITEDRSLFLKEHSTLIVSDIHFNHEQNQTEDIKSRLEKIVNKFKPEKLVLNGDTFNSFPFDSSGITVIKSISTDISETIILPGNHEEKCGGFTDEIINEFTVKTEYLVGSNILIHHGHHTPTKKADVHIIGHIHPAINQDPVYLYKDNAYYNSSVLVLPTFNRFLNNYDINDYNYSSHCPIISDGISIQEYKYRTI